MKKNLTQKIIAILLLLFVASACASAGRQFPSDAVPLINNGQTTRQEIRDLFGPPWRTGIENGLQTWTYGHYKYSAFGDPCTKDLVVRFDEQGKVASYTYSSTDCASESK